MVESSSNLILFFLITLHHYNSQLHHDIPDTIRWPLLVFFATSGVVGVVYGFISPEWPLTQLSVGLTGKLAFYTGYCHHLSSAGRMMVSGAYYICLQYGSEIFPTVIRGQVRSLTICTPYLVFCTPNTLLLPFKASSSLLKSYFIMIIRGSR